jgi:c(7)-type cytochrome triheme protein
MRNGLSGCAAPGGGRVTQGRHVGSGFSRIVRRLTGPVLATVAVTFLAVGACGASAAAQDIRRLPGPIKMTRTGDSPGPVVFNHETHVDSSRPACTTCHPREFRILKASPRRAPITHTQMDKGRYCGTCHNGRKAFALDDCAACHEG